MNKQGEKGIAWTNWTIQLVRFRSKTTGRTMNWCQKVSPGCASCYAEQITRRFHGTQHSYTPAGLELVEPYLDRDALRELVTTRRRGMAFVEDMSDLLGAWVSDAWLDECFAAFALSPLTIQILTKRAERMRAYMSSRTRDTIYPNMVVLPSDPSVTAIASVRSDWPPPNVWLGVSAENRDQLARLDHLRETPAAVRFVSFEPLLEDLGRVNLDGIHLAIIGGESGPKARPCDVASIRSLRHQCRAAGTRCFVKQMGSHVIARGVWDMGPVDFAAWDAQHAGEPFPDEGVRLRLRDSHGGDPAEWPDDLRVRELPEPRRG